MTAGTTMNQCPSDEMLAAFIDGRLEGQERQDVVRHLADCAECRNVVLFADEVRAAGLAGTPANVVRPSFGRRWIVPAAIAASLALVAFLSLDWVANRRTGGMAGVAAAYETGEHRSVQTRLDGLPYRPAQSSPRGGEADALASIELQEVQEKLEAARGSRTWKQYRALGAARLLAGKREEAVQALQAAARLAPDEPAVANDLAAAMIELARWESQRTDYKANAIAAADRAVSVARTPEALWNRAIALEIAGRDAEAIRAWEAYLSADPSSEWRAEAEENLEKLQGL